MYWILLALKHEGCDEMHYFEAVTVERYIAVCRPHHYR